VPIVAVKDAKSEKKTDKKGPTAKPVPLTLLTPVNGALLTNGAMDRSKLSVWEFTWAPVAGAKKYHLYVIGPTAKNPLINDANVTLPSYRHETAAWIGYTSHLDWRWKVRAMVDETWTDWSEERTYNVEPTSPVEARFVIMSRDGQPVRRIDSLLTAIQNAVGGDVVEIQGNGPYFCEPIKLKGALTIRAGSGFRPVLQFGPEAKFNTSLLTTSYPLVLEGLDLEMGLVERLDPKLKSWSHPSLVFSTGAPLHIANCRLAANSSAIKIPRSPRCEIRNSQVLAYHVGISFPQDPGDHILENNVIASSLSPILLSYAPSMRDKISMKLTRNTLVATTSSIRFDLNLPRADVSMDEPLFHIETADNIMDANHVFECLQHPGSLPEKSQLSPVEAEDFLLRLVRWREQRNLYPKGITYLSLKVSNQKGSKSLTPTQGGKSLAEWNKFWGLAETASIDGAIRFQGDYKKLFERPAGPSAWKETSPEVLRLRPDSAGYRAGKDGRDLGADIDLVGPGAAYERWKKTPAYQDWLKKTGQVK
jgi:hypothetical protein